MRGSGGRPFKPGQSGNPVGRPKTAIDIGALAREHGPAAIQIVFDILNSQETNEANRLKAAEILLNRGYGTPNTDKKESDVKKETTIIIVKDSTGFTSGATDHGRVISFNA